MLTLALSPIADTILLFTANELHVVSSQKKGMAWPCVVHALCMGLCMLPLCRP